MIAQKYKIKNLDTEGYSPMVGAALFSDNYTNIVSGFVTNYDKSRSIIEMVLFEPADITHISNNVIWYEETCDWITEFEKVAPKIKSNPELLEFWNSYKESLW